MQPEFMVPGVSPIVGLYNSNKLQDHSPTQISSELTFLKRDALWETEKPYRLRYRPKNGFNPTNFKMDTQKVRINDMRTLIPALSLDVNGFEVFEMKTDLRYEEFDDYDVVHEKYIRELERRVKDVRGARHVHGLDYELRKRHQTFPVSTGKEYAFGQPAMLTHIDVTLESAKNIVRELYGDQADEILASRIEVVTAWKALKGPVEDWPLALCDARSMQHATDVVPADAVYRKFVAENCMIHHDPEQKWYYLRDQRADELLLFKATDSDVEKNAPCAHGAFDIAGSEPRAARESIDVRLLVMYADVEYVETDAWSL